MAAPHRCMLPQQGDWGWCVWAGLPAVLCQPVMRGNEGTLADDQRSPGASRPASQHPTAVSLVMLTVGAGLHLQQGTTSSRSAAGWCIEHPQALRPDLRLSVHVLPLLARAHLKAHAHCDTEALSLAARCSCTWWSPPIVMRKRWHRWLGCKGTW